LRGVVGAAWRQQLATLTQVCATPCRADPHPHRDRRLARRQAARAGFAADRTLRTLLFVGCDWYTADYVELFAPRCERVPHRRHATRRRPATAAGHWSRRCRTSIATSPPGSVDAIVANGVYGFGLDDRARSAAAFAAAHCGSCGRTARCVWLE
jgi:hypothetical protein